MELDMRKFQSKVRNMNIGTLLIFSAPFVSCILTHSVIDLNKREPSFTKNIDMEIAGLRTPVQTYFREFRLTLKSV